MRQRVFITADPHLGHWNLCNDSFFGGKQRPFANGEDMDAALVQYWNETVMDGDKVYVLGDVAIPRRSLALVKQMNGRKILIKGNHDIFKLKDYAGLFSDIRSCWPLSKFVMTHIPLHPGSLRWLHNVHGHTHHRDVLLPDGTPDKRYVNVCVEKTNYRPLPLEEVEALCV